MKAFLDHEVRNKYSRSIIKHFFGATFLSAISMSYCDEQPRACTMHHLCRKMRRAN